MERHAALRAAKAATSKRGSKIARRAPDLVANAQLLENPLGVQAVESSVAEPADGKTGVARHIVRSLAHPEKGSRPVIDES